MSLLNDRDKADAAGDQQFPRCHFFNTFFHQKLTPGGGYEYKPISRWTRPKKLKKDIHEYCDRIVFPIHMPSHWTCLCVNVAEKRIEYYDSLAGSATHVTNAFKKWYIDDVRDKKGQDVDFSKWSVVFPDCPQQRNGFDCGVFAIKFAECLGRGGAMDFRQGDMPYFRKKVACEIVQCRAPAAAAAAEGAGVGAAEGSSSSAAGSAAAAAALPSQSPLLLPDDEGVRRAGCARAFAYLASGRKAKGRFEKPVPLMSRTFRPKPAGKYLALKPDIDKRTSQRSTPSTFRRVGDNRERLRLAYSKMHNLGVFCTVPIPKGKVVLEYIGEKVRASVAQARQRDYHSRGKDSDYLFRLDGQYVLDATRRGGLARFINHSCDPNCFTRTSGHGENKMIQILAKRDIPAGSEIAYDYKFDVEGDEDKIPCYCGAGAKCRKFMN